MESRGRKQPTTTLLARPARRLRAADALRKKTLDCDRGNCFLSAGGSSRARSRNATRHSEVPRFATRQSAGRRRYRPRPACGGRPAAARRFAYPPLGGRLLLLAALHQHISQISGSAECELAGRYGWTLPRLARRNPLRPRGAPAPASRKPRPGSRSGGSLERGICRGLSGRPRLSALGHPRRGEPGPALPAAGSPRPSRSPGRGAPAGSRRVPAWFQQAPRIGENKRSGADAAEGSRGTKGARSNPRWLAWRPGLTRGTARRYYALRAAVRGSRGATRGPDEALG